MGLGAIRSTLRLLCEDGEVAPITLGFYVHSLIIILLPSLSRLTFGVGPLKTSGSKSAERIGTPLRHGGVVGFDEDPRIFTFKAPGSLFGLLG
jgi:hypothetical protein